MFKALLLLHSALSEMDDKSVVITSADLFALLISAVHFPVSDSDCRLLLIKQRSPVCRLAGKHDVYKIDKIAVLPLNTTDSAADLELELCRTHHFGIQNPEKIGQSADSSQMSLRGTWNSIKSAAENVKSKKKELKDREKFEKRILEELLKMYNDSDFFYYSDNFDLTNSLQRQNSSDYDSTTAMWKKADERFFWNKHMLLELMETNDPLADHWMLPVIQGYVQMETCIMDFDEDKKASPSEMTSSAEFSTKKLEPLGYNISIISRRSRHRAGTRSRKRGLNSNGACANYVETEQIIEFSPHLVSFVQVRGSIPVFWSQSGFKYRPPPRLDKA
ncbi:phosphatidylinositide phosphatase SAC2 [Aplysia californica]|uniref:Phosphatidylinositide phosphatase SAC2 n=1 Tax=Aplysia californica TaxID=6500 RepID=A0ABM0K7C7_APLCA|nr:phosphatidylinositide phosphatase SAC2 [Aplysia californica]